MCSVFWLFWLSFITCQVIGYKDFSQEAEPWRGDRLQKAQAEECMIWFLGLFYFVTIQLYGCVVPMLYVIYVVLLWHDIACLCWKCR